MYRRSVLICCFKLYALKKSISCLLPMLFVASFLNAQSLYFSLSNPAAFINAYSQVQTDIFSFTGNQAALSSLDCSAVGVSGERRFLLTENSMYNISGAFITKYGNLGIQVNHSGTNDYNEDRVMFAVAKNLSSHVQMGASFNYYTYKTSGYNRSSLLNIEVGVLLPVSPDLTAGFHISNPLNKKNMDDSEVDLPYRYSFGLGYDISDDFFIGSSIQKEENKPINIIVGFQYQFKKQFIFKGGFVSETSSVYAGAGVLIKKMNLDFYVSQHPQLGITPGLAVSFKF